MCLHACKIPSEVLGFINEPASYTAHKKSMSFLHFSVNGFVLPLCKSFRHFLFSYFDLFFVLSSVCISWSPDALQQLHFPLLLFHFPYFPSNTILFPPRLLTPTSKFEKAIPPWFYFSSYNFFFSSCLSFPQNVSVFSLPGPWDSRDSCPVQAVQPIPVMRKGRAISKIWIHRITESIWLEKISKIFESNC